MIQRMFPEGSLETKILIVTLNLKHLQNFRLGNHRNSWKNLHTTTQVAKEKIPLKCDTVINKYGWNFFRLHEPSLCSNFCPLFLRLNEPFISFKGTTDKAQEIFFARRINILLPLSQPSGFLFSDLAQFCDFTLCFFRGGLWNVHSFKNTRA